jgi:hypothetical protein
MTNRKRLPTRRTNASVRFECEGFSYSATAAYFDDGSLSEIFLDVGKAGTALATNANTAAILASILLQHGVAATDIAHSVTGPISIALKILSEGK